VISADIDQSFIRWFWTGIGVWTAAFVMLLVDAPASSWFAFIAIVPLLGALVAFDMTLRRLPLALSHSALAIFVVVSTITSIVSEEWRLAGVIGGALMMGVIGFALGQRPHVFGRGDAHLCPLLGAMIGWFNASAVIVAILIAAIVGAMFALVLLVLRRVERSAVIPYGPFLMFGAVIAMSTTLRH
jgi:leader peptidase (prepilin peptidase) / N-methyltransferase